MKKMIFFFLTCLSTLSWAQIELKISDKKIPAAPNLVIKQVDSSRLKKKHRNRSQLERKIDKLENMLLNLQRKVQYLENSHQTPKKRRSKTWSCYLQDAFNKTYSGDGLSRAQASARALEKCAGSIDCKQKNLKCSH